MLTACESFDIAEFFRGVLLSARGKVCPGKQGNITLRKPTVINQIDASFPETGKPSMETPHKRSSRSGSFDFICLFAIHLPDSIPENHKS